MRDPEFYDGSADGTQSQYKTAIILIDYPDQPFLITQPPGTHPFGNPQPGWTPVAPEDVNQWMHDYYAVPNQYNGGKTLSGYWMEDSHGKIGIDVEVFGPYTMAAKSFEYGLGDRLQLAGRESGQLVCPAGYTCNRNIRTDGGNAWRAAIGCASGLCGFDNAFYVTAGHDESSTWQEFGEMLWTDRDAGAGKFGPPGAEDGPVLNAPAIRSRTGPRPATCPGRRGARRRTTGRMRAAAPRRRPRAPARASSRTSSATCAGCRTTTTTRSATPTGTTPATGR